MVQLFLCCYCPEDIYFEMFLIFSVLGLCNIFRMDRITSITTQFCFFMGNKMIQVYVLSFCVRFLC